MPRATPSFARFVATPENRAALLAMEDVAAALLARRRPPHNPVLLHGPAGCGKTHLVQALVHGAVEKRPDVVVTQLTAADGVDSLAAQADLLTIEDLHHWPAAATATLVETLDQALTHDCQVVLTANAGPRHLKLRDQRPPARWTNRLAAGLVVAMGPLAPPGRLTLLQQLAQRRQLAIGTEVLAWLAERLSGGGRQLEGAIVQLEQLGRLQREPLSVANVAAAFHEQLQAQRVTVERIVERVGGYFQVDPRQLQSARRHRNVLLPRQVGMYLIRQLTGLSLHEIGAYFGGRDHTTVLHACRKVEAALQRDAVLGGVVRQLSAELR